MMHARALQLAVAAVPALVLAGIVGWLLGRAAGVAVGAAVVVAAAVVGWRGIRLRYRSWGYQERADDLLVRRGVWIRRLSVVPYGRMQFVDVTAGPVERQFRLSSVHLHTAAAHTDARIPGLDDAEAERLRDRLAALGEARAAGL
jgi:membrane protein YdbS with pleckstrin-like domain